jgi:hypothetical protein
MDRRDDGGGRSAGPEGALAYIDPETEARWWHELAQHSQLVVTSLAGLIEAGRAAGVVQEWMLTEVVRTAGLQVRAIEKLLELGIVQIVDRPPS